MAWFGNLIKRWKEAKKESNARRTRNRANYIFQLTEYNSELWLTYNTFLVCPMSMFKGELMDVISEIREKYIMKELTK